MVSMAWSRVASERDEGVKLGESTDAVEHVVAHGVHEPFDGAHRALQAPLRVVSGGCPAGAAGVSVV
jgi:hypothetical protein